MRISFIYFGNTHLRIVEGKWADVQFRERDLFSKELSRSSVA